MTDHPTPEGASVVVPREPTEAMLMAARGLIMSLSFGVPNYETTLSEVARSGFYGEHWAHILTDEERAMTGPITKGHRAQLIYRAMIAAAPTTPAASYGTDGALRAICQSMADDYQTSDSHHPHHVLIGKPAFESMVAQLAALP